MRENHCGPEGSSDLIKRVLTKPLPGIDLNYACKIHDGRYGTKGYSKGKADIEMLGNGLVTHWWNPMGWIASIVEYVAVVFGGRKAYAKAQIKAENETV